MHSTWSNSERPKGYVLKYVKLAMAQLICSECLLKFFNLLLHQLFGFTIEEQENIISNFNRLERDLSISEWDWQQKRRNYFEN